MLVGRTGIVGKLHDPVKQFVGCRCKLRRRKSSPVSGEALNKGASIKRVDLIEWPRLAPLIRYRVPGRAIGPRMPMMTSMSFALGRRTNGLNQQINVRRITWHQQVGIEPLYAQHPAQLAQRGSGSRAWTARRGKSACSVFTGRFRPCSCLSKFFFRRKVWKTRLHPADGINIRGHASSVGDRSCWPASSCAACPTSRLRRDSRSNSAVWERTIECERLLPLGGMWSIGSVIQSVRSYLPFHCPRRSSST